MKRMSTKPLVVFMFLATTAVVCTGAEPTKSNLIEGELTPVVITGSNIPTEQWEIKTSAGKIPEGWEPFGCDYNDKQDPFLLRRCTSDKWDYEAYLKENPDIAKASKNEKIPKEKLINGVKLRAEEKAPTEEGQKWEVKTATGKYKGFFGFGNLEFGAGWEPFAFDSNDEFDPFLLRRKTNNWDNKQKWEIKTSSGRRIPAGWEPFAYDSNDKFDPFLLRRRIK